MSGKKDFQELFNEMAAQLLEKIEERNEEFLEQIRAIQGDEIFQAPQNCHVDAPKFNSDLVPSVVPRIGISHTAQNIFGGISDEKRRLEFMWRFSQAEYSKAAGDSQQWGAYLVMLLEGLCCDCLSRLLFRRVGTELGAHSLELVASFFEGTKKGPLGGGLYRDYGWGIHEGLGLLLPQKDTTFHRILSVNFVNEDVQLKTIDELGCEHLIDIQMDGMPEAFFSLDVVGIYLDRTCDLQEHVKIHRDAVQFLIGPLPQGKALKKAEGKPQIKIIQLVGATSFSIFATATASDPFPQHTYAKVYRVKNNVDKEGRLHWNLQIPQQPETRWISDLKLIDKILITEKLIDSWHQLKNVEMPSDWEVYKRNNDNSVLRELITMRDAYCHNNAILPNFQLSRLNDAYVNRIQKLILGTAQFLTNAR